MKFVLCLLFGLFPLSIQMHSQNAEKKGIRVHYITEFTSFEHQKNKQGDEMVLDILPQYTHYYSLYSVKRKEIQDSVLAIGGDFGDVLNALEKSLYPRASQHYQIWKGVPRDSMLTFTDTNLKTFRYTEPMEQPVWELGVRDTTIIGFHCFEASSKFHQRTWHVWFTTEIPVSEGPWKLHGLPGLVLMAEDADKQFSFTAIEIKKIVSEEVRTVKESKYIDCEKAEYYRLMRLKQKDPLEFERMITGFSGKAWDAKGRPIKYREKKAVFLEKEYQSIEER